MARRLSQLHLSSMVVLVHGVGALVLANLTVASGWHREGVISESYGPVYQIGWPFAFKIRPTGTFRSGLGSGKPVSPSPPGAMCCTPPPEPDPPGLKEFLLTPSWSFWRTFSLFALIADLVVAAGGLVLAAFLSERFLRGPGSGDSTADSPGHWFPSLRFGGTIVVTVVICILLWANLYSHRVEVSPGCVCATPVLGWPIPVAWDGVADRHSFVLREKYGESRLLWNWLANGGIVFGVGFLLDWRRNRRQAKMP
jgi:hypothetical protein